MTPAYPGEIVRTARFERAGKLGEVRIRQYDRCFQVAAFLPGTVISMDGDTPKIEPEFHAWVDCELEANRTFERFTSDARADGWRPRLLNQRGQK